MKWLAALVQLAERLPVERLFVKPLSNKKRLEDLQEILDEAHPSPIEAPPEILVGAPEGAEGESNYGEFPPNAQNLEFEPSHGLLEPRRQRVHLSEAKSGLSTEETVAYQNREIGKILLRMERHYAQKLRINGIPCDCGSQKHLLDLESLCEETIAMVDNPEIYYSVIEWCGEVAPKSTDQAAKSGLHDNEYPIFSRQARDFRKEIIGSLESSALFPKRPGGEEIEE